MRGLKVGAHTSPPLDSFRPATPELFHSFIQASEVSIWSASRKRTSTGEYRQSKKQNSHRQQIGIATTPTHNPARSSISSFIQQPPHTHTHLPTPRTILAGGGVG